MAGTNEEQGAENSEPLSHDPRTWLRFAEPGSEPEPTDGPDPSFDPKTWSRPSTSESTRSDLTTPDRRWLIGAGGAGLVVAIGGGWLLLRAGRSRRRAAGAAAPAVTGGANVSRRILTIRGVGALRTTLTAAGVPAAAATAAESAVVKTIGSGDGELRLDMLVSLGPDNSVWLQTLKATRQNGAGVFIQSTAQGLRSTVIPADAKPVVRVRRGEMNNESFYSSAVNAGIDDSLVSDFAQAFAFDFDFQREVKAGDQFEAVYAQDENGSGQAFGPPQLLYVSLATAAKQRALYRFLAPRQTQPGWFDGAAKSTTKSLMRTPVEGARISSTFGWRIHPILGFLKMHKGVDFAVPVGTPVYASGDATVEWAAMKGPNGNLVILKHDNGWETYYLHLSAFGPGVVPAARLRQGQVVGLSGQTGAAKGPHLHYELHIDGQAVDPMAVQLPTGVALQGDGLVAFNAERERIDRARAAAL